MKNILLIAGTRPNFIKLAPLYHTLKKQSEFSIKVCHTGQHFDKNMSDSFWDLLEIPSPDYMLGCKGANSTEIIGRTIIALNEVLLSEKFDVVIVFGDVNATVSGAIVSSHHRVKVIHVEAGLRSFDRDMPEEVNRVITDHISDYLMVSEESGLVNLKREGIDENKTVFVGNIMIETLIQTRNKWERIETDIVDTNSKYIVATFHRPENVDTLENLQIVVSLFEQLSGDNKIVFPIHPRTKKQLAEFNLWEKLSSNKQVIITEPLDYFTFLKLVSKANCVVTDSGGIQEETSFLNVPCVTLRKNTERPVTITNGTNKLCSIKDESLVIDIVNHIKTIQSQQPTAIKFWDDGVSSRICEVIKSI